VDRRGHADRKEISGAKLRTRGALWPNSYRPVKVPSRADRRMQRRGRAGWDSGWWDTRASVVRAARGLPNQRRGGRLLGCRGRRACGTVPERDRLMFEFAPSSGGVPPWELRLEAPPFEYDPTAEAIVLGGAFFLGLGFPGSRAEGAWFPKELQANFPSLVEVEESQDFHGGMYWLVALTRPSCPEVLELSGPASTCPRLLALTSVPSRPQLRPNCRWRVPRSP
jgi:hypothetical protein